MTIRPASGNGSGNHATDNVGNPNEFFDAGNGNDTVNGGAGNDTLVGGNGNDSLLGGDGNDLLNGQNGNDTLIGNRGSDTNNGGNGSDVIIWNNGDGSDVINGDNGSDTQIVNGATSPSADRNDAFTVDTLAGGRVEFDRVNLIPFELRLKNIETLRVNGLDGNDSLRVESNLAGTDLDRIEFNGGNGNDTLDGDGTATPIFATGGNGNDSLTGGIGADRLDGNDGSDVLTGGRSALGTRDSVNGGAGNDTAIWNNGDGSDFVNGGASNDIQIVNGATAQGDAFTVGRIGNVVEFDRVNLVPFEIRTDNVETLRVNGGDGNDSLRVTANLAATDLNRIEYNGGMGNDTLNGGSTFTPITANGGDGNDLLIGGAGPDVLNGNAGNDTLQGGNGPDVLNGGGGSDVYRYTAVGQSVGVSRDTILSFDDAGANQDVIDLRGIDARPGGLDSAFDFIGNDVSFGSNATGEVRARHVGGNTLIEASTDVDAAAELVIFVAGNVTFNNNDFNL